MVVPGGGASPKLCVVLYFVYFFIFYFFYVFIFTNWENKGCTMVCVGSPEGPFPIWFKFFFIYLFFYNWENKGCKMVGQGSWEDHPKNILNNHGEGLTRGPP